MPYQHPLVVRYDDEGRADGLKETNFLVVSSISASDWVGLPVAGGGIAVSDAEVGQIYFREDGGNAAGIPLPANNTSGYLTVSTDDGGNPTYSWEDPPVATPYPVNQATPTNTVSVWTYAGLDTLFVTPTELTTALASYAQTTALAAYIQIDAADAVNQIYYKSGNDAANGIDAPTTAGTYLSWDGANFAWQTPAGVAYPTDTFAQASVWFGSGISSIAVSAVSAASSAFIGKAVFTGPRQVIYSTAANTPTVTTEGAQNQVLVVNSAGTTVTWSNSDQLPAVVILDGRVDTIEANYVSSDEFDQLTTSAAQISAAVTTIDTTHVAYTDATSNNAIYFRLTSNSASGIAPSTGYLRWDGSKYVWETPAGTGATTLDELNDVSLSGEQFDDILIYKDIDGGQFVNSPLNTELVNTAIITDIIASAASLSSAINSVDTNHVAYLDAPVNYSIFYRLNTTSASGIKVPTNNNQPYVLQGTNTGGTVTYDWVTQTAAVVNLNDLDDVNVPSPQSDQALVYKGGQWVASSISTLDAYLNLQASTQSISTLVTTVNSNYISKIGLDTGSLLYGSAKNTVSYLASGTEGEVLTIVGNLPEWVDSNTLPVATTLDTKINSLSTTVSNNYVSSLQLSAYVPLSAATTANRIYFRTTGNVASAIVAPTIAGTFLKYDNNQFEWGSVPAPALNDLTDVVSVGAADNAVLVYIADDGGWVASSISTIDVFQNLQASTESISTVVNTIFNNYATDTELTSNISSLSTLIAATYASAVQLNNYATTTTLQNLQTSTAQISAAVTTIDLDHVAYADAILSGIYYRSGNKSAAGISLPTDNGTAYFLQGIRESGNLTYSWGTPPGTVQVLNDLTDVVSISPAQNAVLVRKGDEWVASSISTIDVFQNLQASTDSISSVVTNIIATYATDSELTNSINSLSTLIAATYASAVQLNDYATVTNLQNLQTSTAQISAVVSVINDNYVNTTQFNGLSTTVANNYVSAAGDVMTGFLTFNGSYGIKFEDAFGLGGLSASNKITFYSPTEGLSAIQIKSYTNETVGVSAPFIATNTNFSGYHYNNTTPNQEVPVGTYLRQLDKWLYLHVENYNNPTNDDTTGHWALSGLRTKTLNLLSATDASALKDINYPTTPTNGQVLTWENNAWINKTQTSALSALTTDVQITAPFSTGLVLKWNGSKWTPQKDLGSILDPMGTAALDPEQDVGDEQYINHILMFGSSIGDILATNWNISSLALHIENIDQVDGTEIHHYLSSLDQRYLPASGVFSGTVAVQALSSVDFIEFDLSATPDREEGRLYWNDTYKTLELDSANQTSIMLGQEAVVRVLNNTAQTLTRGQVVYISGTASNTPTIALATASAEATTHKGLGVLKQTLTSGQRGLMSIFGNVSGVDTSIYNVGDILYLGVTPGTLTNAYASAPNHPELIGSVITVGTSSTGSILVQVQHGYEIQELHNVSRTPASATGQVLVWNNTGGYYAPGSHNDLAGLTTGNPHTQYATLSGATFTGTISTPTISATTYQNLPTDIRPLPFTILNPTSGLIVPLFRSKHISNIDEIESVIVGGTSATWDIYELSAVNDLNSGDKIIINQTTNSLAEGNNHTGSAVNSDKWVVLQFNNVSGAVTQFHLTLFTY